ncbi:hypothetical protein PCL_00001 [Purpureocillium lilacinum]|uniref:HAT C-terminal dimerisation domain-containing protein n=1 Tax=Purpureocillium lilacinum TaxID=33203 RepID=A0A2U3DPA4_PURLI|nr:hypothetical protein PCL_00001 [Purpureocillium lilacinum]
MLEGDSQRRTCKGGHMEAYGNMWDVASTYEFLMDRLEEWKATAENHPDPEHFKVNINLGWDKLNEYYTKLDETPAYYASAILNPVSRWGYFENTWTDQSQLPWLQEAKRMVRKLWEEEYKTLPVLSMRDEEPPLKRLKVRERSLKASGLQDFDPVGQSFLLPRFTGCGQRRKRSSYPRLSRMALDILSIPPMSAECERLFSVTGQMVSPLRIRLEASTRGITQTLRSWVRNGLIEAADTFIDVPGEVGNSIIREGEEDSD